MISPILFLIMVNDIKMYHPGTELSIFADDNTIYREGTKGPDLRKSMQDELSDFQFWCDTWGFKISTSKTVIVVFRPHSRYDDGYNYEGGFRIRGVPVKIVPKVRFLGVTFDEDLTFAPHVDELLVRCQGRLNLLSCIAGTRFGVGKKPMLTLYRALIRSIIDYGAVAYSTGPKRQIQRLQKVQNKALRLVLGVNLTTPLVAMQNECGEMPLAHRFKLLTYQYKIKVMSEAHHVNRQLFDWTGTDKQSRQIMQYNSRAIIAERTADFKVQASDKTR